MNIYELTPPTNMNIAQAQVWLQKSAGMLRAGVKDAETCLRMSSLDATTDVPSFAQWAYDNALLEKHSRGGTTLSLRGVAFVHARIGPRMSGQAAWDELAHAHTRRMWLNNAPEHLFPLTVSDMLLFGSMTTQVDHDATYGDSDAFLVCVAKSPWAVDAAQAFSHDASYAWARATGLSYRRIAENCINNTWHHPDHFCAHTSDPSTVEVLCGHDPQFSVYSLGGVSWTERLLANSQFDEVGWLLVQALQHNDTSTRAHIAQQWNRAQRRQGSAALAQRVLTPVLSMEPTCDTSHTQHVCWWAALGGAEVLAQTLVGLPHAHAWIEAAQTHSAKDVGGIWAQAAVTAQLLMGGRHAF